MYAKDFRKQAWSALKGKWGTFAITFVIFSLFLGASAFIPFAGIILSGPLTLGMMIIGLKVVRYSSIDISDLFEGFKNFLSAMLLYIVNTILIALWSLLLIIPGLIMAFAYSMSYYILADNPNMSIGEARQASIEMMRGNKWRLFCLQFSFIGWWLLIFVTLGIAAIWITPYMQTANAAFYEDLKSRNTAPTYAAPEV